MSEAVVKQAAEVMTRYLGYGSHSEHTSAAINLLAELLTRDYPALAEAARDEAIAIARAQVST